MADQKISAMTASTTLADTDELVLASSGANKKITGANLKASIGVSPLALLSTTTLASPGIFDVSSIGQAYNDLLLVIIARGTNGATNESLKVNLNNDTTQSYRYQSVYGQGATATAQGTGSAMDTSIPALRVTGGTGLANSFGLVELALLGYASTAWLKVFCWQAFGLQATGAAGLTSEVGGGMWQNTAAINRVQVAGTSTANLATGSQLRIYGRL